jgi:L-rhamnose mutarotase
MIMAAPIRRAFTLRLKPNSVAEYKRYHDNVWPELVAEIEKSGIAQITIFEADPVLFVYSLIYDEEAWDKLWNSEIHHRWGDIMNQFIHFNEQGIADSSQLREIYHLETKAGQKI